MQWSLDHRGAITHVSREWKNYFGYDESFVLGTIDRPTVHDDDKDIVRSTIQAAVERRSSFLLAYRSRRFDRDSYAWVIAGAAPAFSPANGKFLGYLGDTEVLREGPGPVKAVDMLRHAPQDSKSHVVMLDAIADHITTARTIAKHVDDHSVRAILDFALLSIGDLLHRTIRR